MKVKTIYKEDVEVIHKLLDFMETSGLFTEEAHKSMERVFSAMFDCTKEDGSVDMIEDDYNKQWSVD
jgi:hypothetical protein